MTSAKLIWVMFLQKLVLLLVGSYITYLVSSRLMGNKGDTQDPKRTKELARIANVDPKQLNDYEKGMLDCIIAPADVPGGYDGIIGLDSQVQLLRRLVIDTTKRTVNGIILHGVPGTGKTLLARATAKEIGCPFINFNVTTVEDKYVGESNRRLEAIFTLATKVGKCVMFFDEADAIMSTRNYNLDQNHVNSLKTNLLQHMDGIASKHNIVFIAATNNLSNIDKAFQRRLRVRVHVPLPDTNAIRTLLEKNVGGVDDEIVTTCFSEGFSLSDVDQLCVLSSYEDSVKNALQLLLTEKK